MLKQRFKEGSFVKIELSGNRLSFGRLLPNYKILVYDFVIAKNVGLPTIEVIEKHKPLFYVGIYKGVVTKGFFEIIGFKKLEQGDLEKIPPDFWQDYFNYLKCNISYHDGRERNATPEECIGLERGAAWDEDNITIRIEDYYAGRKNFNVELSRPILSAKDIRYLPQPQVLKWDSEKQEFYREDRK